MIDLKSLEFLVNLPALDLLRLVVKIDNCSNNQKHFFVNEYIWGSYY